jgi:hypothetical protein
MEEPLTYTEAIDYIRSKPVGHTIRITKKIAKQLLMENRNVVYNGRVYYLGIRDIGLGLCEIWKMELAECRETKMFPRKK